LVTVSVSRLIERYVDEVLNGGSVETIEVLFNPTYVDHNPLSGRGAEGVDELRLLVSFLALPATDIRFTLEDVFEVEGRGAYRLFGEGLGSVGEFSKLVAHRPAPSVGSPFGALRRGPARMVEPMNPLPSGNLHYDYSCTGIFVERSGRFAERWGRPTLFAG
jgi:hypothetical protein